MKKLLFFLGFLFSFSSQIDAQISFGSPEFYNTGSDPEVVVHGDFNNDGRIDVVVGNGFYLDPANDYKIRVYLQDTVGDSLLPPVLYSYHATSVRSIDAADLNLDGRDDIMLIKYDSVCVFYQNASGTLNPVTCFYAQGSNAYASKIGDVNGDGYNDAVVGYWGQTYLKVWYGTGSGTLSGPSIYTAPSAGWDEIDVAKLGNETVPRIIFMRGQVYATYNIWTYKINLNKTLNSIVYYRVGASTILTNGIAVGDIDGDGDNEMVATYGGNMPSAGLAIWDDITVDTPSTTMPVYHRPQPVECVDVNCDGDDEIVIIHGGWSKASVIDGPSLTTYQFNTYSANNHGPYALTIADVANNDGKPEIISVQYLPPSYSRVSWLPNQSCFTLPLELLSFTGENKGDINVLKWETVSEIDIDYYLIEKSEDRISFEELGRIPASRYSGLNNYQLVDDNPKEGITYYRLTEISFDGKRGYSDIVAVRKEGDSFIKIYPNIIDDEFTVTINSEEEMVLHIFNLIGQKVKTLYITEKTTVISRDTLPSGVYFYQIGGEKGKLVFR